MASQKQRIFGQECVLIIFVILEGSFAGKVGVLLIMTNCSMAFGLPTLQVILGLCNGQKKCTCCHVHKFWCGWEKLFGLQRNWLKMIPKGLTKFLYCRTYLRTSSNQLHCSCRTNAVAGKTFCPRLISPLIESCVSYLVHYHSHHSCPLAVSDNSPLSVRSYDHGVSEQMKEK